MNNKTVLVTGCSSGIGKTVTYGLRKAGYTVYPTARKSEDLEQLKADGFDAIKLDYSDKLSVENAFKQLMQYTDNQLYAVFHNGAYGQPGAVEDLSREVLETQFSSNFFGWHQLNNLLLPLMRHQGYGRIIFNSSVLGLVSLPMRGAYNASKFALEGLMDTLRLELNGSNIYVSLIEPGPVKSHFRRNAHQAFLKNIDQENSIFREYYAGVLKRLESQEKDDPFTLPPEAVLKKVLHALNNKRPKIRYYVTFPTYLFATLKRLLPHRWLDAVLLRVSRSENQK